MPATNTTERAVWAVCFAAIAAAVLVAGCGSTITVNILSSHSRYGQSIGGTNTTIRGQIEGGGSATAHVTP